MVLIKEIEGLLKPKDSEAVAQEDEIIKDSVLELVKTEFNRLDDFEVTPGAIRKNVEADIRIAYPGKPTSRKLLTESENFRDDFNDNFSKDSNQDVLVDNDGGKILTSSDEEVESSYDEATIEEEAGGSSEDEDGNEFTSDDNYSRAADEALDNKMLLGLEDVDLFSRRTRDVESDIVKGKAIINQLEIWDKLIEYRIKLQPALLASNKLYQGQSLKDFRESLNPEEKKIITQGYFALSDLMKALLELQEVLLENCFEYKHSKLKRKRNQENNVTSEEEGNEFGEPESKILKQGLLRDIFASFKPFRDECIQKWNDKTKVLSGRIGRKNFSSYDQPTLKQIEHILLDRNRLHKRIHIKRSDFVVLGKKKKKDDLEQISTQELIPLEESLDKRPSLEIDTEIFDDDDFYHKLLRDFIERKANISDGSKRGRQWIEFQKLRSKVKMKVDTKASKGRKLRFLIHNKIVNFMAPIPFVNQWPEEAKDELFKSLFGKNTNAS